MGVLGFMVQYIQQDQLNYHRILIFDKSKMATFKMAVPTMAYFCCLASKQHFVHLEIIIDTPLGSQFESNVLAIGGFQMFMNLQLSDWHTDGWHIIKLAF